MGNRNFHGLLEAQWAKGNFVCVGLDPDVQKLPEPWKLRHTEYSETTPGTQFVGFCQEIIGATYDLVCAYKPNLAFFERHGEQGWQALRQIIAWIHRVAPDVPVIADAKRGDVPHSNEGSAEGIFDDLSADAITVHPYLGQKALQPFLDYKDKGVFVLCRTSNPGADEFQGLMVEISRQEVEYLHSVKAVPTSIGIGGCRTQMSNHVAYRASKHWNSNGNCGLVVGATHPHELESIRRIVGNDMPILAPGIGEQGGDIQQTIQAGGRNLIISSSRETIFASSGPDFAEVTRRDVIKLRDQSNQYRRQNEES